MPERCQAIDCPKDAEFELIDGADRDYETSVTYACEEHVGALLTHAIHMPADTPDEWTVRLHVPVPVP